MLTDDSQVKTGLKPLKVDQILLAAEVEFAERGFEGAGMKGIAKRGDVSQALLHYHFGTKDKLYAEVIAQRSKKINEERLGLLAQVDLTSKTALSGILNALFRPPLGPSGGARSYARIFSGLIVGRERDQALVKEHYDPTAQKFIESIRIVLGHDDRVVAAQSYTLALGALIAVIARDGRVERLMGESRQKQDIEEILEQLIKFSTGGVLALAAA
ncbi:TetR/AcrR family transcriptional regulator [Planktotalea sp.]|uniref:TetR/AcrR family transcriptional regulator n=1 Tax=Planktotalea sp. TaxID=2029877 RepID=UPI003298FEBC